MATASHDALEHFLFDFASKHTEPFRLTKRKSLKFPPTFDLPQKFSPATAWLEKQDTMVSFGVSRNVGLAKKPSEFLE
jgi:hypothetical protein